MRPGLGLVSLFVLGLVPGTVLAGAASGSARDAEVATNAAATTAAAVRWRSQRVRLEAPPAAMPEETRAALASVAGFAVEQHYRLDVSPCGRVVLVTDADERTVHSSEGIVRKALEEFDRMFPAAGPGRAAVVARLRCEADGAAFAQLFTAGASAEAGQATPAAIAVAWVPGDGAGLGRSATDLRRQEEGRLARAVVRGLVMDRYGRLPAWLERGVELSAEAGATGRFASIDPESKPRTWRIALKREPSDLRLDLDRLGWRPEEEPEIAPGVLDVPLHGGMAPPLLWGAWDVVEELRERSGALGLGPLATALAAPFAEPTAGPGAGSPSIQVRIVLDHAGHDLAQR